MNFQKSGVMNAIVFFSIMDTEQRWEGSPAAPLKIQWRSGANSQKKRRNPKSRAAAQL